MHKPQFEWGTVPRGIYIAMSWLTLLVAMGGPRAVFPYAALLIFLGLFLRPLLERSGLYGVYSQWVQQRRERRWRSFSAQRRKEVESCEWRKKEKRLARYRDQDPRLLQNW